MIDNFCIFILSHGRANKIYTINTLKRHEYTGKYYIVIDTEDKTKEEYYKLYGKEKVIIFDKLEISKTFDEFDNLDNRKTIVYARNACFEIAEKLNIKYFMQLDDDYTNFRYKFDKNGIFKNKQIRKLDYVIEKMLKLYKNTNALTIAMSQGGDFIGGKDSQLGKNITIKRKAMNSFLCSTNRKFKFIGRINEDVNTYIKLGSTGKLIFTVGLVSLEQKQTQSNNGGMTDIYIENGTYIKSFYTIICNPSCVKLSMMGSKERRIHHKIIWKNAVPCILDEKYKK